MSRIGNSPIIIPEGVTVTYDNNIITVKGKLGEMTQEIGIEGISIILEEGKIKFNRENDQKEQRSAHGLFRSLVANMVTGVSEGFSKKLELRGVGYRATTQGNTLDISAGYSHNIVFEITPELKVIAETEKGKAPIVTITGCDKQLVGTVAAKIREIRKPEPYKGKGIRYVDEYVRKKAGKTAAAS